MGGCLSERVTVGTYHCITNAARHDMARTNCGSDQLFGVNSNC